MAKIIITTENEIVEIFQKLLSDAFTKYGSQKQEKVDRLLSLIEAAEFLKLAPQTLYGFTSKRTIPFIKKGKKLYFRESLLNNYLETGRKKSRSEIEHELNQK